MVLADRVTREGQQTLRRCRSHKPSRHPIEPSNLFPDGRKEAGLAPACRGRLETAPFRPEGQPGQSPRRLAQAQRKRARPRTFAIGAGCHGAMKAGVFGAEFAQ
jgi:hypothetical protein